MTTLDELKEAGIGTKFYVVNIIGTINSYSILKIMENSEGMAWVVSSDSTCILIDKSISSMYLSLYEAREYATSIVEARLRKALHRAEDAWESFTNNGIEVIPEGTEDADTSFIEYLKMEGFEEL